MSNQNAEEVVLAYHAAFYRADRGAARALLADRGEFKGPLSSYSDPDTFLDAAAIFMRLAKKTEIKKVLCDGEDVCVLYDGTYDVPSIPALPMAAWFKVESGKIKFFHVHFDPSPFVKAKESGELAAALKAKS